jgi:predicted nucleic acid-binding protein
MIILDTNVVSEAMHSSPSASVMRWLSQGRSADEHFLTTITLAEILYGIELLPRGKRRDKLLAEAEAMFREDFSGRILPFDEEAARAFAEIAAGRRSQGRPMAEFDAQIAAITRSRRAILATCNTQDFEGCGVRLENPWQPADS